MGANSSLKITSLFPLHTLLPILKYLETEVVAEIYFT